jgi:hypothetical protein
MTQGESKGTIQPVIIPVEFYRGVPAIAQFLCVHERTVRKLIHLGKIPVKRDEAGVWVLVNVDYYNSLLG